MSTVSERAARAILRCVPDAGSGEVVSVHELKERLGVSSSTASKVLLNAVRAGTVERVRTGRYRLAAKQSTRRMTLTEVWHLALTDGVVINATTREVIAKGEDEIGWRTVGVLADGVSIADAEAEITEAYGK